MWSFEEFKTHVLSMKAGVGMEQLYDYVRALNDGRTLDDDFSMLQAYFH
jgi:hypothetical protein